ncbi:GNAT family N-acetyltransferase (plasmid) [Deinococcus sp. KNUC1210]|uniref:GNAT family N-acetyltransferase n=1 Tax=Deinococcus sp. KNUC1210 TaxID=2917691 RepID=UPI001EF04978|nr:GNAT family N-acetyltransferase [Deinococcus sp. KNUC1210]ULH13911.1 GNAT family N-acetyltransferase [Deinococcus sp. KNUC1210]
MKLQTRPEQIEWPPTPDGDYARRTLTPLLTRGSPVFVHNAHVQMGVLSDEQAALPITFDPAWHDTFTVSPVTHLAHYAAQELHKLALPALDLAGQPLLKLLGLGLRRLGFERTVYVNNWLLSTNLYPHLTPGQLRAATRTLLQAFPDRPLAWRSLDPARHTLLIGTLEALGYVRVPSRLVTYQDPREPAFWKRSQLRTDASRTRLPMAEEVQHHAFTDDDLRAALRLYQQLYLEKYSSYNPQFTLDFLRLARDERVLELRGLRLNSELKAVRGSVQRAGVTTTPLFGYDLSAPQREGWYRRLSLNVLQDARQDGLLVNASSGVGAFKRARGGVAVPEYTLVLVEHLSAPQRHAWHSLAALMEQVLLPLLIRHDL